MQTTPAKVQEPDRPLSAVHIGELDGLRGIAILLVMLHHSLFSINTEGFPVAFSAVFMLLSEVTRSGVDLFFVLSGYLISGILIDSRGKVGYYKSFLARRSLRIFPLYYLVLLFLLVATLVLFKPGSSIHSEIIGNGWTYFLYVQNFHFAFNGWPDTVFLTHFWSLAVEEQFYLFWPAVVAILAPRRLLPFCIAVIVGAFAIRLAIFSQYSFNVAARWSYVLTITRMDMLAAGAAIAVIARQVNGIQRLKQTLRYFIIPAVLLLFLIDRNGRGLYGITTGTPGDYFFLVAIHSSLWTVVYTYVLIETLQGNATGWWRRCLRHNMMVIAGRYSYSMYLLHPVLWFAVSVLAARLLKVQTSHGDVSYAALSIIVGFPLQVLISALLWHFFEKPILKLRAYFPRPGEPSPAAKSEA